MRTTTTLVQLNLYPDQFHRLTTLVYATDTLQRRLACVTRVFTLCKAWIEHQAHLGLVFRTAEHSR